MTSKFSHNAYIAQAYTCTYNEISARGSKKCDYMYWGANKRNVWVRRCKGVTEHCRLVVLVNLS